MSKQQNLSRTKIVVALLASASLVACQTSNEGAGTGLGALLGAAAGGALGGKKGAVIGALAGALVGNRLGAYLDKKERRELQARTAARLDSMEDGETLKWTNPDSGARVDVTPGKTRTIKRYEAIPRFKSVKKPRGLEIVGAMFEVEGDMANVRRAPRDRSKVLDSLSSGENIWVIGRLSGGEWYYVEKGGFAIGYVSAGDLRALAGDFRTPTMRQAINLRRADEKQLAAHLAERGIEPADIGGDKAVDKVVVSSTCRNLKYEISAKGKKSEENFTACKAGDGSWEISG